MYVGKRKLTFLATAEERAIFLQGKVDVDEVSASQELHDHSGGDNRRDSQFHEGSAVRGEDDSHPVKRV